MKLKHLIHIMLAPLAYLIGCMFIYVFTGRDMLPSPEGGRWIVLIVLSIFFTTFWSIFLDTDL